MNQLRQPVSRSVREVYITDELRKRPTLNRNVAKEKRAFQEMASAIVSSPTRVLPRLVDFSMELCEAVAGGISLYEEADQVFRWHHLRGTLEKFTGSTTPRNDSPCGVTLDLKSPVLVQRPERVYSWLCEADVSLPECLLVPLSIGTDEPIGTLWIVSKDVGHFCEAHALTLTEIAAFAGVALHTMRSEERLRSALEEQEVITREMGHRVKNLFAIVQGMVPVAARRSGTKDEMVKRLSARLRALSNANAMVRPVLGAEGKPREAAELGDVISAVLEPYDHATISLDGPALHLGPRGTNTVALILYELATNASKYGAFSREGGRVSIVWSRGDGVLTINWTETGGPHLTAAPENAGFGSNLVAKTVAYHKGHIVYDWQSAGLKLTITLPESSIAAQA